MVQGQAINQGTVGESCEILPVDPVTKDPYGSEPHAHMVGAKEGGCESQIQMSSKEVETPSKKAVPEAIIKSQSTCTKQGYRCCYCVLTIAGDAEILSTKRHNLKRENWGPTESTSATLTQAVASTPSEEQEDVDIDDSDDTTTTVEPWEEVEQEAAQTSEGLCYIIPTAGFAQRVLSYRTSHQVTFTITNNTSMIQHPTGSPPPAAVTTPDP
ncbi:uncharacterized protein O3C94_007177 [Discoglossus pictus]